MARKISGVAGDAEVIDQDFCHIGGEEAGKRRAQMDVFDARFKAPILEAHSDRQAAHAVLL